MTGSEDPAIAAERARERLHEEIERVRAGVEEMISEGPGTADLSELRRELSDLHEESRRYAKRRVRKSERRLQRSIDAVDQRTAELEQRLDSVEQERRYSEWRMHNNTEQMLDGLLREVRAIADLLTGTR